MSKVIVWSMKRLLFCFLLTSVYNVTLAQLAGKVIAVADGDTFTMLINRQSVRVRLHGVDCPEKGQDFANVAKDFLSSKIAGRIVTVKKMDMDRYRRTIGMLTVDSININEALLQNGLAWHYKHYDNNIAWAKLEDEARKSKTNIWSLPSPIPPWEYRKTKKR